MENVYGGVKTENFLLETFLELTFFFSFKLEIQIMKFFQRKLTKKRQVFLWYNRRGILCR